MRVLRVLRERAFRLRWHLDTASDAVAVLRGRGLYKHELLVCSCGERFGFRALRNNEKARVGRPFPTRPERFELPTFGSVDRRSIQLSYGRSELASLEGELRRPGADQRLRDHAVGPSRSRRSTRWSSSYGPAR